MLGVTQPFLISQHKLDLKEQLIFPEIKELFYSMCSRICESLKKNSIDMKRAQYHFSFRKHLLTLHLVLKINNFPHEPPVGSHKPSRGLAQGNA